MSTFERRNYADQLNIETPEQVDLQFHVAGMGSRFVAALLDHIIQTAAFVVIVLIFALIAAGAAKAGAKGTTDSGELDTAAKWIIGIIIFVVFCLHWGYFSLFEAFWHGQTPGKRVMKLRVIKDSGRQITLFEALARNLLRYIDYLPSIYLIGVITMLCNKQNKRLGDLAAGTLVVHEAHEEQPLMYHGATFLPPAQSPQFEMMPSAVPAMFPADAVARLRPADLQVIDTFFARALDLPVETRASMALKVASGMATKMGVALPEGNPERALEAMAMQIRGGGRM